MARYYFRFSDFIKTCEENDIIVNREFFNWTLIHEVKIYEANDVLDNDYKSGETDLYFIPRIERIDVQAEFENEEKAYESLLAYIDYLLLDFYND